ncbi:hypothetical protein G6O67_005154 [Ophiocordyceps sinensis]|uniref:Fe2OG dioxygenase domain-containing protein n=1 Tax=Ophiocordyceps sinensis TaxID=72228 RepID=A0A8H4PR39_9HYPO|nr:hypothetical protein G6O67_005154 [Ophiocordyceps sinensis]
MANRPADGESDFDSIPIVDLAAWRSSDPDDRQRLASRVYDVCTQVGFFYIKNHGISENLIERAHEAARRFFSLPEEVKMQCFMGDSKKFHGFSPVFAELSTGTDLDDPAEQAEQASFSEAFDIGYEIAGDATKKPEDPLPPDTFSLYGDNQWPREQDCPGFRKVFLEYYVEVLELCRDLMRIFAQALGLRGDFFDGKMDHPGAMARMLHYPPQPVEGEVMAGLAAHTDYECVTVLSQGHVPALQVLNRSGQWLQAYPIPGTLVVNIGDCLAMWTNNRFKSTIHRVSNLTGQERYAVPFFFGVDYDTTISVLENCITEDSPAGMAPIKAGEHIRQKLSRSYVGYGATPPDPDKARRLRAGLKEA